MVERVPAPAIAGVDVFIATAEREGQGCVQGSGAGAHQVSWTQYRMLVS